MDEDELQNILTYSGSDETFVTRLSNGEQIILNAEITEEKIQKIITEAEAFDYENILLLCTGTFKNIKLKSSKLFLPEQLVSPVIAKLGRSQKMGLMIPQESQKKMMTKKWSKYEIFPLIASASPYSNIEEIIMAAKYLENEDSDFILMDCMGYTEEMRKSVFDEVNIPIILSNTLMAKILSEIL
ncbi:AroM family protein [Salinicoccus albus]|uniref:AroM family protein n=1 Tax=Salinicoccus albus TaxID=418756 RepID=UPI00036DD442|nr:AroM family protein [Salinicoccus albus]